MLAVFGPGEYRLDKLDIQFRVDGQAIWVDLREPDRAETELVEKSLGLELPSREAMERIEESSRLYRVNDRYVMTAMVLVQVDTPVPERTPITFVINQDWLITIRFADSHAISKFVERAAIRDADATSPVGIMICIIDAIVDRQSELIEKIQAEIDDIARSIFLKAPAKYGIRRKYADVLQAVGREGEIASRERESLSSLQRLLRFLTIVVTERGSDSIHSVRVEAAARDVQSLADHVNFLLSKITFLLDATLGLIGIEQSNVVKILSIAALVFLPPTLIASVYGMNFHQLPGLEWDLSLPLVILAMAVSAVLPLFYMRFRGWL